MGIEVATGVDATTKEKGDLLEQLAEALLGAQQYEVATQVRLTGSELDLLCTHRVSREEIYVECKAHRDPLSANVLKNILGELEIRGLSGAWLISTAPLGKDLKGLQTEWEARPAAQAGKLRIYTPERVVDALIAANTIVSPPEAVSRQLVREKNDLGDWKLLVTPHGRFWVRVCLASGVPSSVLVFSAGTGVQVKDQALLERLATLNSSVRELDFTAHLEVTTDPLALDGEASPGGHEKPSVVLVTHGDSWSDYRPARPQDFVGREAAQKTVLDLLAAVRGGHTDTRVFAITGDSGIGKSSLIAKLRARCKNKRYKRQFYTFAVDVRAATSTEYVLQALLQGLRAACDEGFLSANSQDIAITDPASPLSSPSVQTVFDSLRTSGRVFCLVFDQFEELYSKPELFGLFDALQRLLLATAAAREAFVLGFAWKTDAMVQQDHPAYYMWHRLADHRLEVRLPLFSAADASKAVTAFERELRERLKPELRRQLLESSQGYPWLLKKLCIHVYEQIQAGSEQSELIDRALDIGSLFERDTKSLSAPEDSCLRAIARSAPADWYEILDAFGLEVLRGLQDKRLVIRSGDRLNVYWDIFREYLLTRQTPFIPLSYLPASQVSTALGVSEYLQRDKAVSNEALCTLTGLTLKSVGNVVRDLVMFGVAEKADGGVRLEEGVEEGDSRSILVRVRSVLRRHALTLQLAQVEDGTVITAARLVSLLRQAMPTAQHRPKTWGVYAARVGQWFEAAGYLGHGASGWTRTSQGEVVATVRRRRRGGGLFLAEAPPDKAIDVLHALRREDDSDVDEQPGVRNALASLRSLGLVHEDGGVLVASSGSGSSKEACTQDVLESCRSKGTIRLAREALDADANTGIQVGAALEAKYQRGWSPASERVNETEKVVVGV